MTTRFRFGSDGARREFEDALEEAGQPYVSMGDDVTFNDPSERFRDFAASLNAVLIHDDDYYQSTSGLQDSGLQDTQAVSSRSNPPPEARGGHPPDYDKQIVSQNGFPQRRSTWGQPDGPYLPSGIAGLAIKRDKRR